MRVLIDMQGAQTQSRFRGIGRYTVSFVEALLREKSPCDFTLLFNAAFKDSEMELKAVFEQYLPPYKLKSFSVPANISWDSPDNERRRIAAEEIRANVIRTLDPDVLLISSLFEGSTEDACISVESGRTKVGVILYDLIPLTNPDNYLGVQWAKDWYFNKINHLTRCDFFLSISEYSKQVAVEKLHISANLVRNISGAADERFAVGPRVSPSENLNRLLLDSKFILYTGALEARKNLPTLLEAFAGLPETTKQDHLLLFAGKATQSEQLTLELLSEDLGISDRVLFSGYISDQELVYLYQNCSLFVFPSLLEGFGLPVLEAVKCGAVSLGANASSIPEVLAVPSALFDGNDSIELSNLINRVLTEPKFQKYLVQEQSRHAEMFSWSSSAQVALDVFGTVEPSRVQREPLTTRELVNQISLLTSKLGRPSDDDLISFAIAISDNERILYDGAKLNWRVEGPFDSSYSLALLNRETARALSKLGHSVSLHSTEGPGDFDPDIEFLEQTPDINEFYRRGFDQRQDQVVSRNLYPPRVTEMEGQLKLMHHYAWEESGFPQDWANDFCNHLDGVTCLSTHVEKILLDNGVHVPLGVSGCGVDHWVDVMPEVPAQYENRKRFRFLHVSSCFPRKGVDVLLEAFGEAFSAHDDVELLIKTFPNPHNNVEQLLEELRQENPNYPPVLFDFFDYPVEQLKGIVGESDAVVAPSCAEGFGLPLAEALLSGVPVITTGWGGQLDFCTDKTSWLVDYDFEQTDTHFNLYASVWAKPKVDHLIGAMLTVFNGSPEERQVKVANGKKLLLDRFKWTDVAERLNYYAQTWYRSAHDFQPRIGWVSTWNEKCGIATYSEHLIKDMEAEPLVFTPISSNTLGTPKVHCEVVPSWSTYANDLGLLQENIVSHDIQIVVIQFNYSFFRVEVLSALIHGLTKKGVEVVMTMHSTNDPVQINATQTLASISSALKLCRRILVHTIADLNKLKGLGLVDNVTLFPHGVLTYEAEEPQRSEHEYKIGSYGFFLPNKGLKELIMSVGILVDRGLDVSLELTNAEYDVPESAQEIRACRDLIEKLKLDDRVSIETSFLEDDESLSRLSQLDVVAFPYQVSGESASGAVRYGLAAGSEVVVTPLSIFDDLGEAVLRTRGIQPEALADCLEEVIKMGVSIKEKRREVRKEWIRQQSYSSLSKRLSGMLKGLVRAKDSYA